MAERYPSDQRGRALRTAFERLGDCPSPWAAAQAGAEAWRRSGDVAEVDRAGPGRRWCPVRASCEELVVTPVSSFGGHVAWFSRDASRAS